jgi:hypothetical protein
MEDALAAFDPLLSSVFGLYLLVAGFAAAAGRRGGSMCTPPPALRKLPPVFALALLGALIASLDAGFERGLLSPAVAGCLLAACTLLLLALTLLYVHYLLRGLQQRILAAGSISMRLVFIDRAMIGLWLFLVVVACVTYSWSVAANRRRVALWSYPFGAAVMAAFGILELLATREVYALVCRHVRQISASNQRASELRLPVRKAIIVATAVAFMCFGSTVLMSVLFVQQESGAATWSVADAPPGENRRLVWLQAVACTVPAIYLFSVAIAYLTRTRSMLKIVPSSRGAQSTPAPPASRRCGSMMMAPPSPRHHAALSIIPRASDAVIDCVLEGTGPSTAQAAPPA